MNVLIDTSVWSLAFRRAGASSQAEANIVEELSELIQESRVLLIGPIRQELLSGLVDSRQFESLRRRLRAFADQTIDTSDSERAAEFSNTCRHVGIQGSHVDFLICSVAAGDNVSVFTTDTDFKRYAKHLPFALHEPRPKQMGKSAQRPI